MASGNLQWWKSDQCKKGTVRYLNSPQEGSSAKIIKTDHFRVSFSEWMSLENDESHAGYEKKCVCPHSILQYFWKLIDYVKFFSWVQIYTFLVLGYNITKN